jgi:hypothetical protein
MKPGILKATWPDKEAQATCSPDGWQSDDAGFASLLQRAFPPPATEVGTPWVRAFWEAAKDLGAEVIQKPEPDPHGTGDEAKGGGLLSTLSRLFKRSPSFRKAPDPDQGDETERINLIADILYHYFGDDAIAFFDEGAEQKAWDAAHHPRGPNGRFIPKNSPEAVAAAKTQIKDTLRGKPTPKSHKKLAEHLNLLNVKQLGELKKQYGISADGRTKAQLVAKLAERLSKGRMEGKDRVSVKPDAPRTNKPKGEPKTVHQAVIAAGGIDAGKLGGNWNVSEEFAQAGLLGVFRKGGMSLDEMAESLAATGHISVPEGVNADEHLMERLRGKAQSLHASYDDKIKAAEEAHYKEVEDARRYAEERSIEESRRVGAESGAAQGRTSEIGAGLGDMADEEGAGGEVGGFDPGEFEEPAAKPKKPLAPKPKPTADHKQAETAKPAAQEGAKPAEGAKFAEPATKPNPPTMTAAQYRASRGLPATGIGLDHSTISPNGRVSQRSRNATSGQASETIRALSQSDGEYEQKVLAGEVIEPGGSTIRHRLATIEQSIQTLTGQIAFYAHIGRGASGSVKPKYQRVIDEYKGRLAALHTERESVKGVQETHYPNAKPTGSKGLLAARLKRIFTRPT